jgi:hypothetical protein
MRRGARVTAFSVALSVAFPMAAAVAGTFAGIAPAAAGDKSAPGQIEALGGARTKLYFEVSPVIGESGGYPMGAVELLVRIRNGESEAHKGVVTIENDESWGQTAVGASAPFSVAGNETALVRIPLRATGGLGVSAKLESGEPVFDAHLYARTNNDIGVALLTPTSPARPALMGSQVAPTYNPPETRGGSATLRGLTLLGVRVDGTSGDPILPERTIGWTGTDLVVARTDLVARLGAESMEALAGFVLGGGTLALVVARPEDLRGARVTALLGGEAQPSAVAAAQRVPLPSARPGYGDSSPRTPPDAAAPKEETRLTGWSGGNLEPSAYGASAVYGLGEVVLLGFDPDDAAVISDPFVKARMMDLARRSFDRRSTAVLQEAPNGYSGATDEEVRRQLDPNESTRWTIGVAAILLLAYAIIAGPISFSRATKKGKPLRALWHLPIWSLATFLAVVALGAFSKGFVGRSRRLTLVDAGAGVNVGVARRYRGFYAARATDVVVRATDRSSFPWMAEVDGAEHLAGAHLEAERDGARLVDVPALPWECVVVREEGFVSLGEGITIEGDAAMPGKGPVRIGNQTGRALRGVIVKEADDSFHYLDRIDDAATVSSADGINLVADARFSSWVRQVQTGRTVGRTTIHPLNAYQIASSQLFDEASPGLGDAWRAIDSATGRMSVDWFPRGVPVVLAQIEGGEGTGSDSGFRLDKDRLLVRVVGWGK